MKFHYDSEDLGYDIISIYPSPLEGDGVVSLSNQGALSESASRRADEGGPSKKQVSYSCNPPCIIGGPQHQPNGPDTYTVDVNGDTPTTGTATTGTADDVAGVLVAEGDNRYVLYQQEGAARMIRVSSPVGTNPNAPVVDPKETQLEGDLTRVFGGGTEGQGLARAYINNPPQGMTREAWIRSQHEQFHPSGGGEAHPPEAEVLKNRLTRNLEYNIQHRYELAGASADRARETAQSFRVPQDSETSLQNLMGENDRFGTLQTAHTTATTARPVGAGMTEDQWRNFAQAHGYMMAEGIPARDLNPTAINPALELERNAGNNYDRLRAYVRTRYSDNPQGRADADAFMETLPSDPAQRNTQVNVLLQRFETSPGIPNISSQPDAAELTSVSTTTLNSRATTALTALGYNNPPPGRTAQALAGMNNNPAALHALVQRAEALQEAQAHFVSRGGSEADFRRMAGLSDPTRPGEQHMNWLDASGNIRPDLNPSEVRTATERFRAIDSFNAMLEREGYPPEQRRVIMDNLRFPPVTTGTPVNGADPAVIRAYETEFARSPVDRRNAAMLQLAQNNVTREYASKMNVSEDVAGVYLTSRGFISPTQTLEAVGAEQQRIRGLDSTAVARRATPNPAQRAYQDEHTALQQATGADARHHGGTEARMNQLRQNPLVQANHQYAQQISTLDHQYAQQWGVRQRELEMTGRQNLELADRNHQNAIAQQDHKAVLDERLVGIQHENALELERMRIQAQMMQTMIQFLGQMITAAMQALSAAHQGNMQALAGVNQSIFQGFKHN